MLRVIGGTGLELVPDKFRPLMFAAAIFSAVFWFAMLILAPSLGLYLVFCGQPAQVRIAGTTLTTLRRNGPERSYSLKELVYAGAFRFRFLGGHGLTLFFAPNRIRMAAEEALRLFNPKLLQSEALSNKKDRRFIRVAIISILGAISAYLLVVYFTIPDEESDGKGASPCAASLGVLFIGLLHAIAVTPLPARILRRYHRWSMKKRRSKLKSASAIQ